MISADEIRSKEFSRAGMNGYKKIEVDALLDEIVSTLNYLTTTAAANEKKIADYELKLNEYKADEQAIKSALVNAERVSEQLVSDAQIKADDILFKAKTESEEMVKSAQEQADTIVGEAKERADALLTDAEKAATELTEKTEKMTAESIDSTKLKTHRMVLAAEQSVKEQQALFDELKVQVAMFRRDILARFDEQIQLVSDIPDEIEVNPTLAASMVENEAEPTESDESEQPSCNDIERIIEEMRTDEEKQIELFVDDRDNDEDDEVITEHIDPDDSMIEDEASKKSSFTVNVDFDDEDELFGDTDDGEIEDDDQSIADDESVEGPDFDSDDESPVKEQAENGVRFVFSREISDAEE